MNTKLPIIFLMGPTASGKTNLAMSLYDTYPIELISVDSALVYQGMDIGTAKPTASELSAYPHELIDIKDPLDNYSAAEFYQDAHRLIDSIHQRGKIPLLVGGTMLYFKALLEGLSPLPTADVEIRQEIEAQAAKEGWPAIHSILSLVDPIAAQRIHENDSQRLSRALEVYRITGHTLTDLQQQKGEPLPYPVMQFALQPENRSWLHQRIEMRFKQMLANGFIPEVEKLMARGDLNPDMPSMRCVGYRQAWEYLEGQFDYNEFVLRGVCATRQLAKRQITWLRSWQKATAINCEDPEAMVATIKCHIEKQLHF